MNKLSSYKDLKVYIKSYEIAKEAYSLASKQLPKDEQYGLSSQIKRAATSIPLNIAEGYGKAVGGKELRRFLTMARGSCCEMEVLMSFVKDFGYISLETYEMFIKEYNEIGRMLTGLIHSVTD
jgi:four helix bundle protein